MATPKFGMEWRAEDTEASLKERFKQERHVGRRTRLHAMWLLRTGKKPEAVAETLAVGKRTVQRWCDWYRQGGMTLVLTRFQGSHGENGWLTAEQHEYIHEEVATGRFHTALEVREWIAADLGVNYRPNSIYTVMKRIEAGPKVPRPHHEKADDTAQEAWKKGGSVTN